MYLKAQYTDQSIAYHVRFNVHGLLERNRTLQLPVAHNDEQVTVLLQVNLKPYSIFYSIIEKLY